MRRNAAVFVAPPYVLVGFSAGGAIAVMYAQAHPDAVAGFVSMNPVPPARPFLSQARRVETKDEYKSESVGERGHFVRAKGAGHDIEQTRPKLVYRTIDGVLRDAGGG